MITSSPDQSTSGLISISKNYTMRMPTTVDTRAQARKTIAMHDKSPN